ncbi:MAG: hypothetical protein ACTSVZ_07800 [Promethearchaeota archaeon]
MSTIRIDEENKKSKKEKSLLSEDPAWINLEDCFSSEIDDLSENVDEYIYKKE